MPKLLRTLACFFGKHQWEPVVDSTTCESTKRCSSCGESDACLHQGVPRIWEHDIDLETVYTVDGQPCVKCGTCRRCGRAVTTKSHHYGDWQYSSFSNFRRSICAMCGSVRREQISWPSPPGKYNSQGSYSPPEYHDMD